MTLEVTCACGKRLCIASRLAGRTVNCPFCGGNVTVVPGQRGTDRIIIPGGEQTARLETRAAQLSQDRLEVRGTVKGRHPLPRRGLLVSLGFLSLAALLGGGYLLWQHRTREESIETSRRGMMDLWEEGETLERRQRWEVAHQLYERVVRKARTHLETLDGSDAVVQRLARQAQARARRIERQGHLALPELPPPASARELVERDPWVVYLDFPASRPGTEFTVAGPGLLPDSSLEDVQGLWGEPEAREVVPETVDLDRGLEVWSYQERFGFQLQVRPPAGERAAVIEKLILLSTFPGRVDRFPVQGSTRRAWEEAYGAPTEGSIPTMYRYERPFAGVVRFDEAGAFQGAWVNLQRRR
jgi:hypothetical protein